MSSMHSMNSPITVNLKPWLFLHTDSSLMLKQFYFWKIYAHMFIQYMYVCINITPRVLVTHKVIFEVFPFCTKQPNPQTSNPRSIIMTDIFSAVLNITFSIEISCPCGLKKLKKKKKSVDSTVFSSGASACLRTHMNPEKGKGKKKASCNAILRHLSIKSNSLPLPPPIHTSSPHPSLVCLPHTVLMLYICQSERCRGGREQRNRERDGWPWRCHWYAPRCSLSPDKDPPPQSGCRTGPLCVAFTYMDVARLESFDMMPRLKWSTGVGLGVASTVQKMHHFLFSDMNSCSDWISSFSCGGKRLVGGVNLSGQTDVSVRYWLLYLSLAPSPSSPSVFLCWDNVIVVQAWPRPAGRLVRMTVRIIFRPRWWFWDLIEDELVFRKSCLCTADKWEEWCNYVRRQRGRGGGSERRPVMRRVGVMHA